MSNDKERTVDVEFSDEQKEEIEKQNLLLFKTVASEPVDMLSFMQEWA
jgi:hypothetical protein